MELKFRDLRADEIECRIGTAKDGERKGVSLLLYKDARVDMTMLDETVGATNWKREHSRENANCIVSIWDDEKGQWISKEDTGTESKTEAEKGLASDSFKRACVNWGIGRELYSSPFIWISGASKYDKFWVKDITIENKRITALTICRKDDYGNLTDDVAYQYPKGRSRQKPKEQKPTLIPEKEERRFITAEQAEGIKRILMDTNSNVKAFLQNFKVNSVEEIPEDDYQKVNRLLQKKLERMEGEKI